jgi:hypothetical protein
MFAAQAGEARMFEEVPRTRRGLAGLAARHIVLGPFLIVGVLLAAVGGSVAVAATVITSSATRSDVPPPARHPVAVASSSTHRPASAHPRPATTDPSSSNPVAAPANPVESSSRPPAASSTSSEPAGSTPASSAVPQASPSLSPSGPAGNAIIHVTGFDPSGKRMHFQFAEVSYGTGPGGSDVYQVSTTRQYSATLADDLTITSGGLICPPAGSSCSTDQLIAAADTGFFAIAAIDPADQLHSIIEVDNVDTSFGPAVGPSLPTASPTGT